MFGIGFPELILILALALIVVGPDKLPDLARSVAKTILDLKKTAEGLKDNIGLEDNPLSELRPELEDAAKKFKESVLDTETQTWKRPSPAELLDSDSSKDADAIVITSSEKKNDAPTVDSSIDEPQESDKEDPDTSNQST